MVIQAVDGGDDDDDDDDDQIDSQQQPLEADLAVRQDWRAAKQPSD